MKFRGRMIETLAIRKFYSVIGTMARISKVCVMRLTADKVYFILTDTGASTGGPVVWCEMEQENFFNEYNIEGVSAEQNEIFLELVPERLTKTLTTLKGGMARGLKIKLTKKNDTPCLTFEVELPSLATCVHDIPVQVLPRRVWKDYAEPPMPQFDVSICLPDLKKLKHLTERYKALGQSVTISMSRRGALSFKVEGDDGVFSTHYPNQRVPVYRDDTLPWRRPDDSSSVDPDATVSVRVELRRFSMFLSGEQLLPKRSIANVVDQDILHMFFVHDDLVVQFFLPATNKP